MTLRTKLFIVANFVVIAVLLYALDTFFIQSPKGFDAEKIVRESVFRDRTFAVKPVEIVTPKGFKIWALEEHSAPLIAFNLSFKRAGFAYDPALKEGLSYMTSCLMLDGAGAYNTERLNTLLELNGIKLGFNVSAEDFEVSMLTPSENKEIAFKLLSAVLIHPHFTLSDIKVLQAKLQEALKAETENPEKVLSLAYKKVIFKENPLGRNKLGTAESVSNITQTDLKKYVSSSLAKNNMTIAAAGDFERDEIALLADSALSKLSDENTKAELEKPLIDYEQSPKHLERQIPQIISIFALPGVQRLSEDFYPLYVANYILGGSGLTSRLNIRAREKEGLTYGISTALNTDKNAPRIEGTFSASEQNYTQMRQILTSELQKLAKDGVFEEEFEKAKNSMLSSFNLRFLSVADISAMLLEMQKQNLGLDFLQKRNDYVKNIQFFDVNRVAKKYFNIKPVEITIGNKKFTE